MAVGKGYENGAEVNEAMNSVVQPPCKMGQSVSCKPDIGTSFRWFDFRDGDLGLDSGRASTDGKPLGKCRKSNDSRHTSAAGPGGNLRMYLEPSRPRDLLLCRKLGLVDI